VSGDARSRSLLILACSARKAADVRRGPAWDVYDGRVYQVLKKLLRVHSGWEEALDIVIVSARYGVIRSGRVIQTYDDRLTPARAANLARRSGPRLRHLVEGRAYRAAHANLGRAYRLTVPDLAPILAPTPIDWALGGIGERNARTRDWVVDRLAEAEPSFICGPARRPSPRQ